MISKYKMNNFANGLHYAIIHAIMITGFVAMMMVLIEYLNILSQGKYQIPAESRDAVWYPFHPNHDYLCRRH